MREMVATAIYNVQYNFRRMEFSNVMGTVPARSAPLARQRPLNFRQLEAFRAVMLAGGMTAGGQLLAISQPAVTRLIRDLEHAVGLLLFHRQGAQVVPTREAEMLYEEVERNFAGAERIRDAAEAIRQANAGHLHVGCMPNLAADCVPEAAGVFLAQHPSVTLAVHPHSSTALLGLLARGQLDVAYAVVPTERRDLRHEAFAATPAVCAMPASHPLAVKAEIRPADLDGVDFIALAADSVMQMQIDASFADANAQPRIRVRTVHSSTALAYVHHGIGVAVVDRFATAGADRSRVVLRPFRSSVRLRFSAVHPPHGPSVLAAEFTRVLRGTVERG